MLQANLNRPSGLTEALHTDASCRPAAGAAARKLPSEARAVVTGIYKVHQAVSSLTVLCFPKAKQTTRCLAQARCRLASSIRRWVLGA